MNQFLAYVLHALVRALRISVEGHGQHQNATTQSLIFPGFGEPLLRPADFGMPTLDPRRFPNGRVIRIAVVEDEREVVVIFQRLPLRPRIQLIHWIDLHQGMMNPSPKFMSLPSSSTVKDAETQWKEVLLET